MLKTKYKYGPNNHRPLINRRALVQRALNYSIPVSCIRLRFQLQVTPSKSHQIHISPPILHQTATSDAAES